MERVKMSFMSWTVLVFLLSTTGALGAVDLGWLARVVAIIKNEYKQGGQICIAVKIPMNLEPDQLLNHLGTDRWQGKFKKNYFRGEGLSVGTNVIMATFTNNEHAESRVLASINQLVQGGEGHFLLFYTYLSPCAVRCAMPEVYGSILDHLNKMYRRWTGSKALVFEKPCKKLGSIPIEENEIITSFRQLGDHGLGRTYLFRCYAPSNNFQCFQCFSSQTTENVARQCLDDSEQGGSVRKRNPSPGPSYCSDEKRPRALSRSNSDMSIGSSGSNSRSPSRSPSRGTRKRPQ